ncbi:hypothetical protein SC206_19020 [Rouxiella sp. T17]|uniref:hypothetical protein n=1 Tax=Rouxiella sp. T17 TaxID=3085684 RepID=UPI002FCB31F8
MADYHVDFRTIKSIMKLFLDQPEIINKLRYINSKKIGDWEKWLQLELEYFIQELDGIEVERELHSSLDKRMDKLKNNAFVDLIFRKNKTIRNSYFFVELKCKPNPMSLLDAMEEDWEKVRKIKSNAKNYNMRTCWFIGFYQDTTRYNAAEIKSHSKLWFKRHNEIINLCQCELKEGVDLLCEHSKIGMLILGHPVRD